MLGPKITIKRGRRDTNSEDKTTQHETNTLPLRQSHNSFPSTRRKLPPLECRYKDPSKELNSCLDGQRNDNLSKKVLNGITSVSKESIDKTTESSEVTNNNSDDDPETTFPKVARTIQMASTWLKKSRKRSQQQRADSFLDRLEMFGPSVTLGNIEPSEDPFDMSKFNVATYKNWTVDPSGRTLFVWLVVVAVAVLYNLIFIIARQCFHELHNGYAVLWFVLDYLCDIIYGLDIFVQFRTGTEEKSSTSF
jgi:hypothetical protein